VRGVTELKSRWAGLLARQNSSAWAKRHFQIADIQKIAGINWFQSALAGDGHERSHSGEE